MGDTIKIKYNVMDVFLNEDDICLKDVINKKLYQIIKFMKFKINK